MESQRRFIVPLLSVSLVVFLVGVVGVYVYFNQSSDCGSVDVTSLSPDAVATNKPENCFAKKLFSNGCSAGILNTSRVVGTGANAVGYKFLYQVAKETDGSCVYSEFTTKYDSNFVNQDPSFSQSLICLTPYIKNNFSFQGLSPATDFYLMDSGLGDEASLAPDFLAANGCDGSELETIGTYYYKEASPSIQTAYRDNLRKIDGNRILAQLMLLDTTNPQAGFPSSLDQMVQILKQKSATSTTSTITKITLDFDGKGYEIDIPFDPAQAILDPLTWQEYPYQSIGGGKDFNFCVNLESGGQTCFSKETAEKYF